MKFLMPLYKEDSKINARGRQTTTKVGYSPMETTPKSQSNPISSNPVSSKIVMEGITFDDVLLIPQASNVMPATAGHFDSAHQRHHAQYPVGLRPDGHRDRI